MAKKKEILTTTAMARNACDETLAKWKMSLKIAGWASKTNRTYEDSDRRRIEILNTGKLNDLWVFRHGTG